MCNCHNDIEKSLTERAVEKHPEATDHNVSLKGYAFLFGKTVEMKGVMPFEFTANFPLKKGGFRRKVEKSSMVFTYCPFCGIKYE